MRLGIAQPNFLPWLGYFELLNRVDFFVVLDNVQLTKQTFMVRNKLFDNNNNVKWRMACVASCTLNTMMQEAYLYNDKSWWELLYNKINEGYKKTPYWDSISKNIFLILKPSQNDTISKYNWRIILYLCDLIGIPINNNYVFASELEFKYSDKVPAQKRVLDLCKKYNAKEYYNSKKGVEIGLYDPECFQKNGIKLWKQNYNHPIYPQHRNIKFTPYLSIIDLICCVGPDKALEIIKQGSCWVQMNS